MAFWDADLTTRMGAESATDQGGIACFVVVGLTVLGAVMTGASMGFDTIEGMVSVAAIGIEAVIFLIAGLRFRAGKGAFWGIAAAVILVLEILNKLITLLIGFGIIFNVILLVLIIQGVRGAWALRNEVGFSEDDFEVFE